MSLFKASLRILYQERLKISDLLRLFYEQLLVIHCTIHWLVNRSVTDLETSSHNVNANKSFRFQLLFLKYFCSWILKCSHLNVRKVSMSPYPEIWSKDGYTIKKRPFHRFVRHFVDIYLLMIIECPPLPNRLLWFWWIEW